MAFNSLERTNQKLAQNSDLSKHNKEVLNIFFRKARSGGAGDAILYLTVNKLCYDQKKCKAPELSDFLKEQGLDSTRTGNYLGNYENYIHKEKGETGKPQDTVYWAKQPGIKKTEEILKEMVETS